MEVMMKFKGIKSWVGLCLLIGLVAGCSLNQYEGKSVSSAYDVADKLQIIPTPREISLDGKKIDLKDWEIVLTSDKYPLYSIGAEEINQRIVSLGGEALPAVTTPSLQKGSIIVGSWPDPLVQEVIAAIDVELNLSTPGEQGYVIEFGTYLDNPIIFIGGSDAQGALYGCVTLRKLMEKSDNGVVALSGSVKDWPDFKIRNNGILTLNYLFSAENPDELETITENLKEQIDFFLRHKVNYTTVFSWGVGWHTLALTTPDEAAKDELFQQRYQKTIEVLHYARDRGIKTRFQGFVDISKFITDEQKKGAITKKSHPGSAYIWSAFDAHRKKASLYAKVLKEVRASKFVLHCVDLGPYTDPQKWSERSPLDKEYYRDDERPKADLNVYKIYFDAIREACPNIELEAVAKPYHFTWVLPDFGIDYEKYGDGLPHNDRVKMIKSPEQAKEIQQESVHYYKFLSENLPDDVVFTFREAGRETFLAAAELVAPHPLDIWVYPQRNYGWAGTFCPQVRMTKTFWVPGRHDSYYVAYLVTAYSDERVQRLAQQEYLWNVDTPDGTDEFTIFSRYYENGGMVTDFQRSHLIPRICKMLYGKESPTFQELVENNVSFSYIGNHEATTGDKLGTEKFDDPYKYMEEEKEKNEYFHKKFDVLLKGLSESADTIDARTRGWIISYYEKTGVCAQKAPLEIMIGNCKSLMKSGLKDEAKELAENIIKALPETQKKIEDIKKISSEAMSKIDSKMLFMFNCFGNHAIGFDPLDYKERIEKILSPEKKKVESSGYE